MYVEINCVTTIAHNMGWRNGSILLYGSYLYGVKNIICQVHWDMLKMNTIKPKICTKKHKQNVRDCSDKKRDNILLIYKDRYKLK